MVACDALRCRRKLSAGLLGTVLGPGSHPASAETICNELNDLPVRLRLAEWFEYLINPLYPALGAYKCSIFFERGGCREHDIGKACGFRETDVLHYEEVQHGQGLLHVACVRIRGDRIFALEIEHF